MQKIVHIMLAGPVTDGWNYQDNMITKYHRKLGYDVTMITSQWVWGVDGKLEKVEKSNYLNNDDVRVKRIPIKGKDVFSKKLKRFKGLREELEFERPDILFIHNISFLDIDIIIKYLKYNRNVKVYVDNHSDFSNSATNWLSKNILHKILWKNRAHLIKPYTSKFYGVLPARVDFLKNIYQLPENQCELLVMGADDDKVEQVKDKEICYNLRQKYNINKDDFLIITGGKIDKWKKQTLLLMEAVSKIKNPKVKLIVFGSVTPDLKDKLEEMCVPNKVEYIGWVNAEDSYKYFATSDLVVFPGRHSVFWEQVVGQGIPMLCKYWEGTTHIDIGGNVDFLYQDSVEELKSKIENIINNPEVYYKMKNIAVNQGMKYFSYKEISRRSIQ